MKTMKENPFSNKTCTGPAGSHVACYAVPCIGPSPAERPPVSPVRVSVPGSKSITNRALLLATLAEGTSTLHGALFSDDSRHFISCIRELGFETQADENRRVMTVTGHGGRIPKKEASIYVGSAGTAARFLTAYLGVSEGIWHIDASGQMRRRPMAPLLASLCELGCEVLPWSPHGISSGTGTTPSTSNDCSLTGPAPCIQDPQEAEEATDHLPVTLRSHGFCRQHITVNIDHSSQFLSALLIASCLSDKDFHIQVDGSHGMAYIDMTCRMMEQFGVSVDRRTPSLFCTGSGQHYHALNYRVEPDVSAACYFYAMTPLLRVPMLVEHVHFDSLQGDVAFIRILEQMGCSAQDTADGILLTPPDTDSFAGVTADMSACSDQAITLAAIAPFASTPTTITGIGHIRFQESNRIHAMITQLDRLGIRCEEREDGITIYPGSPQPASIATYDDHRMAMGFSLTGLRAPGIRIQDPSCCRKTFEDYFTVLEKAIQDIKNMIK